MPLWCAVRDRAISSWWSSPSCAEGSAVRPRRLSTSQSRTTSSSSTSFSSLPPVITSLPDTHPGPSEQSALPACGARSAGGPDQPFLELAPRDAPDSTDPYGGDPFRVWVVHRAKAAQNGRGVNAETMRHFFGGQVLVVLRSWHTAPTALAALAAEPYGSVLSLHSQHLVKCGRG